MAYKTTQHQREKKRGKKENEEQNMQWSLYFRKDFLFWAVHDELLVGNCSISQLLPTSLSPSDEGGFVPACIATFTEWGAHHLPFIALLPSCSQFIHCLANHNTLVTASLPLLFLILQETHMTLKKSFYLSKKKFFNQTLLFQPVTCVLPICNSLVISKPRNY